MRHIHFPEVTGVTVAIAREESDGGEPIWRAYLLNKNNHPLVNVIVASTGYGVVDGEKRRTSTLRQLIPEIGPGSFVPLELVTDEVLGLVNEFWVSYYKPEEGSDIYDKRFLFVPETITEGNLTYVPFLEREAVLHN